MADIKLSQGFVFFKEYKDVLRDIRQRINFLNGQLNVLHADALQGNYDVRGLSVLVQQMTAAQTQGIFLLQNITPPENQSERILYNRIR